MRAIARSSEPNQHPGVMTTRRLFRLWTAATAAAFFVGAFAANCAAAAGDWPALKRSIFVLAAIVPAMALMAWRHIRRVHFGLPPDEVREVSIPTLIGLAAAAALWGANAVYSASISAPMAPPRPPKLGGLVGVNSCDVARPAAAAPAPSLDPRTDTGILRARI